MRLFIALVCMFATCSVAMAENAQFKFLKSFSVKELNRILDEERTTFLARETPGPGYQLPAPSKATNAVDVYTVVYESRVPELDDQPKVVTGLLAIPRTANASRVPLIAYQHGTVFGKYEVPSFAFRKNSPAPYDPYPGSYETRHIVALFGGNGYAVMAADYFGMGGDAESDEAYMIKGSSAQSSYDLYRDVVRYLASQDMKPSNLFLAGWSQGGLNTTGLLEKLETAGVNVKAAFTAAAPNDPFASLNGYLFHPLPSDAPWVNSAMALSVFACEKYIGPPGLAKATINPNYYARFKSIYDRSYGNPPGNLDALYEMIKDMAETGIPNVNYLRAEYRDKAAFAASDFGKCLADGETVRQDFKTRLRMYYGTSDEAVRIQVGLFGYLYHLTLNGTPNAEDESKVTAIPVKGGTHRLTFINAASQAKPWIDWLR